MAINNRDFRTSHLPALAKQHENMIWNIMELVILLYYISQASLTALLLSSLMLRLSGCANLFKTSGQKQQPKKKKPLPNLMEYLKFLFVSFNKTAAFIFLFLATD